MKRPVEVNQDVNCHAAELELNESVSIDMPKGRQAYMLCVEGALDVNGKRLTKYDGCEIHGDDRGSLGIKAAEVEETENGKVAHFLMFSMNEVPGSGRKDVH